MPETITSVEFHRYKAFRNFSIKLNERNILVGPNNCGKSTIIGAFRVLAEGVRKARSKSPEFFLLDGSRQRGYRIPPETIPISTENVHTNYEDVDSSVSFRVSNGNKLHLRFPSSGGCVLIPETTRTHVASPTSFKTAFPITVAVVPVLGPLEQDEPRVEPATVQRNLHTTRASRHFRNYWMYYPEAFERFSALVNRTWPEMQIERPTDNGKAIHMFATEERIPRELFWSGFGFQVWCQLLTHLERGRQESILVVDEPEIYLHADMQRQLVDILFSLGPTIVMATHSAEIIGAADFRDLVLIDKKARSAQRVATEETVQTALDSVGSLHNVALTRIAKHRKVLFVEGEDYRLFMRLAKVAGMGDLASSRDLPSVASDGFNNWTKIRDTAWGIKKILKGAFKMASILDRDFRSAEELEWIKNSLESEIDLVVILQRKEIENYLLVPGAISRGICKQFSSSRAANTNGPICDPELVKQTIMEITDEMKNNSQAQYMARRNEYLAKTRDHRDDATRIQETGSWFDGKWATLEGRIEIAPGKDVLARLREWAQEKFQITLTTALIFNEISCADLAPDMKETLAKLDDFRNLKPPEVEVE